MRKIVIVTEKKSGSLTAFSVLTTACEHTGTPYQTVMNNMSLTGTNRYENENWKFERLEIKR